MTETEVAHINATLNKIDKEIAQLQYRRSHLRCQLNGLVSSTRNLPPEVLTEIFRLSSCILNLREPQLYSVDLRAVLRLGSVCSHWRRVAWSAPHLWTTCLVAQGHHHGVIPPFLISLALSNSQGGCVSVKADLDDLPFESVQLLFRHYSTRIRALQVYLPDIDYTRAGWDQIAAFFRSPLDWPNLNELWVCSPGILPSSGLLLQNPGDDAFRYCRLEHDNIPWYPPMQQLTVLRLLHFPIDQCLYLLLHCHNLTEFHCLEPSTNSVPLFYPLSLLPRSDCPKTLPNIKILRWKVDDEEWNFFLFSSVRFPNLERLYWGGPHIYQSAIQGWDMDPVERTLIEKFMPSLRNIIALDWETSNAPLISYNNIFAKTDLKSIQRLHISTTTASTFITWLEQLTIYQHDGQIHLPNLRILHAQTSWLELSHPGVFNALCKFLHSRRNGPISEDPDTGTWDSTLSTEQYGNHTRLEMFVMETAAVPPRLEHHQIEALKSFVANGLAFELLLPHEEGLSQQRTTTLE
ncbi:hypothetical protein D9756_009293 [Leucocoprinus leucothites]|uniref:F-box domain-containing protein n=1 Tax=Leucocoprinus leucothites TaxID=201217 RepID=A0A8H5CXY7_9AGAR|nr:hypothetical protein D9756_009293 [Leucoagaricus leucothites]